jgi:cell division protein FtsB
MRIKRILISIALGTLCYVGISFVFGESGVLAEKQLIEQKDMLVANINTIQKTQDSLILKQKALTEDTEVIASYAKQIGYISEGESLLKISGIPSNKAKQHEIGKKYLKTEIFFVEERISKTCGIVIFILSYLVLFLFSLKNKSFSNKQERFLHAYS